VSQAAASIAATGAVSGLAEDAARSFVQRIRDRIRSIFAGDERSTDALEGAIANPDDESQVSELASALAYYARKNEEFARQLSEWARHHAAAGVTQNVKAGRDAYVSGRDMTVYPRPAD